MTTSSVLDGIGPGQCDCPESVLLRELVRLLDSPAGLLDRLASSLAVWKLRGMSHELSTDGNWAQRWRPWAKQDEYDTPPETAEEIRVRVAASWAEFERRHAKSAGQSDE